MQERDDPVQRSSSADDQPVLPCVLVLCVQSAMQQRVFCASSALKERAYISVCPVTEEEPEHMEELNRSVHTWIEESEHSGAGSDDGLSSPSAAGARFCRNAP
jgi:hypothetical protein